MKIKTNPAQAISSIFSLGDSIPVANSELLAKQWGKVRISKRALGAWNRFEERTLKEFWNDAGRQANGNLAKQKQIFAERTEEYFSEFSSEGLFGYNIDTKTIKISEMEMVLENGTVRPLTQGPSTVIGEDILRKTYAQVAVEETMHGMSFGRIGSHKGIFAAGNFYFPFTEQLDEFYCWMKSLDPNDLRRLADGETLKALEADLCEADIAIWLKNQGIPFTPKRMANYKIRELLIYWYENVKGTSYF